MMKKIFGDINLSWPKVIGMAIFMGVYTAIMAMIPAVKDTSFSDLTVTFEVWIFFGIFIIMNSKSSFDSCLKCFVFFLISQPLVYIVQDIINGSNLFNTYYRNWVSWTVACLPMGYFGYYMKKDKWWGLVILAPIMFLLGGEFGKYLSETIYSFPRHLLTAIFCAITLVVYPLAIFKDKKLKIVGEVISGIIIVGMVIYCIVKPYVYSTDVLLDGENRKFDDTYKVYFKDDKYGDLSIRYIESIESWSVHADFVRAGKTEFILESPDGERKVFEIDIKRTTFKVKEKK